jgi:DNA repair protein RecO (recombination protein O)
MATRSASFDAIILRAKEVPSGARVVTLLSADEGIVEAFVFGGGKSKLRSLASPWYFGKAWIYRDASRGLVKLTDFDAVREYPGIRADLPSIAAASFASEFMAATSALGGDWADALSLCADFLSALDEASGRGEPEATARALALFAMRALELMGLSPDGDECSACAGALRRDTLHSYSRRTGGFLCARCAASENDAVALPAGALAWLEAAAARSFGDAVRVGLGRDALSALKACALDLARKAADAPLRTLDSGLL